MGADAADEQCCASSPPNATGEPAFDPSIWNCTDPDGTLVPKPGHTRAVNATGWPASDGFCEDVTAVAVPTGLLASTLSETVAVLFDASGSLKNCDGVTVAVFDNVPVKEPEIVPVTV